MISGFDFDTPLPIAPTVLANYARNPIPEVPVSAFQVRGGVLYPDTGGPKAAWQGVYGNFMPRAGFSWQPQQKTAVRGGYGLFYDVLGPTASAPTRPAIRAAPALTAVARQRPDLHCDAHRPVPERDCSNRWQRPRA
jgi:hypothetical protein